MESPETFPVASALALVLATAAVLALLNRWFIGPLRALKRLRGQGVPGYPFRPVIGNFPEMIACGVARDTNPELAARTSPAEFHCQGAKQFGKVWTISIGTMPWVVLNDPQLVRAAFMNINSIVKPEVERTVGILHNGLVLAEGEQWARQRKLLHPAFQMNEMKRIYPLMVECVLDAVHTWRDKVEKAKGTPLLMDKEVCALTINVICVTAFGANFSFGEKGALEEMRRVFERYTMCLEAAFTGVMLFPLYPYLPVKNNRELWSCEAFLRKTMKGIIAQRLRENESARKSGETAGPSARVDILQLMLEATEGRVQSNKAQENGHVPINGAGDKFNGKGGDAKPLMSTDELMAQSLTFLFGGHETTAVLMTWTMMLLGQHSEWQVKAREEVLKFKGAAGDDWAPSFEEVSEMKLLNCILHESLRLYSPAASPLRYCEEDTALSETLTIPKGCEVLIAIDVIHHSKELWGEDADDFNPMRFANGVSSAASQPGAFLPFTSGPRVCIGQNFSLLEGKLILALLLSSFKWKLAETYMHHPTSMFMIKPKFGMPLIMESL